MTEAEMAAVREMIDLKFEASDVAIANLNSTFELKLSGLETGIRALDNKLYTATTVQGEKVLAATASLDHRLEEMMNQVHKLENTSSLSANNYLTRQEHETWKGVIESQLKLLHDFELIMRTKASSNSVLIGYIMTGILFAFSVINFAVMIADKIK